jgi:hypothetical protein
MKAITGFWVMAEVMLLALAMATAQQPAAGTGRAEQPAAGTGRAEQPAAGTGRAEQPVAEAAAPALTDDEKKDLTILNQGMTIQQQRFQMLQAQMAVVQQEYSRLAGMRNERLAKAKADHKWGEDVSCNPEELTCTKAAKPEKK